MNRIWSVLLVMIMLLGSVSELFAQRRGGVRVTNRPGTSSYYKQRNNARYAKKEFWELTVGAGITNFLGDVGGSSQIGTNFARDLNMQATHAVFQVGIKRFYIPRLAQKINLSYGWVRGDDKWSSEPARNNRNLNFRSPVFEFSTQFEVFLVKQAKRTSRYKLAGLKGKKSNPMELYLFGGVGGFWFDPKGQVGKTSQWVALQPLCTEGQGYFPTRDKYQRISVCFPMGIGFTFRIADQFKIGLELGLRKTLTDYMDDVSTSYVQGAPGVSGNVFKLTPSVNPTLSNIMADKNLGRIPGQTNAGQQRGDPRDRDSYMFLMITGHYIISGSGRSTMPKFF